MGKYDGDDSLLRCSIEEEDENDADQRTTNDSRSTAGTTKTSYLLRKRTKPFVDTAPKHRTAMGDYIPPEGKGPLTSLAAGQPSPSTYMPNSLPVQFTYPQWSIYSRNIYDPKSMKKPAPNRYTLPDELNWKRRRVPMSHKLYVSRKQIAGPCKAGPAGYKVDNFKTGKLGFKYTIAKSGRGPIVTGPPNKMIEPCDSPGFSTPGPDYWIMDNDGHLPHSFCANFTHLCEENPVRPWPAPSDYYPTQPGASKYPAWTISPALKRVRKAEGPAPNAYDIPTRVGEGPAYSFRRPIEIKIPPRGPSPTAYMREREYSHKEKIQLHMRFPEPTPDQRPSPNKYNLRKEPKPDEGYSLKGRVPPSYPVALNSAFADGAHGRSPGPAAHGIIRHPYQSDSEALKGKTMGKPFAKLDGGQKPGPSDHGMIDVGVLSTKPHAPVCSVSLPYKEPSPPKNPGPAGYKATPLDPGLAASFKSRPKGIRAKGRQPGPAAYVVKPGVVRTGAESRRIGVSLHSRQSPFVYSGFSRQQLYARS